MNRKQWLIVGMLFAATVSLVAILPAQAQQAGASPVAVCDIAKVFAEYQRAKDLTKRLNDKKGELENEDGRRKNALEALQAELEGFRPGSEQHTKTMEKMEQVIVEREVWMKVEQGALLRQNATLTKEMYEELRTALAELAQQRGIVQILQLESGELGGRNPQEMMAQMINKKVLYSSPTIDLTDTILQKLNEAYRVRPKN